MTALLRLRPENCFQILLIVSLSLSLSACASRPGPEVLRSVEANASGATVVPVYVATTRESLPEAENLFGADRATTPQHAEFEVSVPPGHEPGKIEWPRGTIDPSRHFAVRGAASLSEREFMDRIASRAGKEGEVGVFVHGFNYTFGEALYRVTQMATDSDLVGAPVLFTWPSAGALGAYVADRDSATYSRDALADLLVALAGDRRIDRVTVFGHSMGAWLTMESLRQLRLTGQDRTLDRLSVVLAAPDIDIDVFRSQIQVLGPMAEPIVVLVSPDDRALQLSSWLGRGVQRLGALDVSDPRVEHAARDSNVTIVDITNLPATNNRNHDRYVALAALYPQLAEADDRDSGVEAGAFVFSRLGAALVSPFTIIGDALASD